MLDTSNLSSFLKGITDAIRAKKGTTGEIQHSKIDEEIESINDYKKWCDALNGAQYCFYSSNITDEDLKKLTECGFRMADNTNASANASYAFFSCYNLTEIPNCNTAYILFNSKNVFEYCRRLKVIKEDFVCSLCDYSKKMHYVNLSATNFNGTPFIEYIGVAKETLFLDSDLSWCANLNAECRQSLIHGLAKVEQQRTFKFHSSVVDKFTDEQFLEASNKNWNIG